MRPPTLLRRIRRSTVVAAAALVAVASAGPASAQAPVAPEVRDLPAALAGDLSNAEQQALTALTEGEGVRVSALVDTGDGPEVVTVDAPSQADARAAARLLDAQPSVDAAEVPVPVRAVGTDFTQYGNAMVRSAEARPSVGGPLTGVVVAVLDTGVARHPELSAVLLPGRNFTDSRGGSTDTTDRQGHGTHVAGTIAADAGSAVEGIAHGARILPVKVLADDGGGWSDWIAGGIIWAADNGADVINLSLGGPGSSSVQTSAIAYARSRGVTVIAAAGNAGTATPSYPAADPGVIAVAAVDHDRVRASFSNYGGHLDVAAPGVGIVSTYLSGRWASLSGTSMAAPHVAGVAALVEGAASRLSPAQVEQVLVAGATDLGPAGRDDRYGHGLVDAVSSVRAARALVAGGGVATAAPSAPRIGRPEPANGGARVRWAAPADDGGTPVTGYRIATYRDGTLVRTTTAPAAALTAVVGSLTNGVGYRFSVRAVNATGPGPLSARSTAVTPRTVPGAPRIGTAGAARGAAVVRWAAPATTGGAAVSGYVVRVFTGGRLVRSVPATASARSLTVGGLTPGTAYAFRVLATNVAGTGVASAASNVVRPTR